jgi:hypothetical protein
MSREIKFRAWDGERMFVPNAIPNPTNAVDHLGGCLMEFTGICDSKGQPIYEGDILRGDMGAGAGHSRRPGKPCSFEVVATADFFVGLCFSLRQLTHLTGDYRAYPSPKTCIVIGNKHQHPHLLGVSGPAQP